MAKQLRVIAVLLVILAVFSSSASAYEVKPVYVRLSYNEELSYPSTSATTVEEFLNEQNITLTAYDTIEPPLNTPIDEGLNIDIATAFDVYVRVDGASDSNLKTIRVTPCTLSKFIVDFQKSTGYEYIYDYDSWHVSLTPGMIIELSSCKTSTFEQKTSIDFETEYVESAELEKGIENVLVEGSKGEKTVVTSVDYVSGKEISREIIKDEITAQPVNRIIQVGTKNPPNVVEFGEDVFEFKQEFSMTATAYTNDYESTGKSPGDPYFGICATGMKARVGVVAVDPNVIPLYTKLYIEDYGYAIAGDTGGAIKGHKIDLFFDTAQQCRNFGRQTKKVYVIE